MTEADLDEIEKRAEAAKPGPWIVGSDSSDTTGHSWCTIEGVAACIGNDEDAEFMAAARDDIPALVAWARKAREVLALLEWDDTMNRCQVCGAMNNHRPDCELSALLK